jgi:FKBP-type peptidyl-prolyl cis-trans isomerase SlyD
MSEQIMDVVAKDMVVKMDYTLYVDGEVIDSSQGFGPLEFIQGRRNIIAGLDKAILGMQVGETREIKVAPNLAYGEYDNNNFIDIPVSQFPPQFDFQIGKSIRLSDPTGRLTTATITEIGENDVRLDMNHPLAGKELTFNTTIVDVRPASDEELRSGRVGGGSCNCGSGGCSSDGCGSGCG